GDGAGHGGHVSGGDLRSGLWRRQRRARRGADGRCAGCPAVAVCLSGDQADVAAAPVPAAWRAGGADLRAVCLVRRELDTVGWLAGLVLLTVPSPASWFVAAVLAALETAAWA